MTTTTSRRAVERIGRWTGGLARAYLQRERRAIRWLAGQGLPWGGAEALAWTVKLVSLGVLLYAVFWLTLGTMLLIFVARQMSEPGHPDDQDAQPEWREGHAGWGVYDKNEWRHDPGGPGDAR